MKRFLNWLLTFGKSPDTIVEEFDKNRQTYTKPGEVRPGKAEYRMTGNVYQSVSDTIFIYWLLWGDD